MPIYIMSLFWLPKSVKFRLEKIQRDFLWGGGKLEKKIHLVKWDTVCLSKKMGGLGIRNLPSLNRALLGKWNWRFAMEENSSCRFHISLKYGVEEGGWFSKILRGSYGVGLWKEIIKEAMQLKQNCSFDLGDGCKVRFWEDAWCDEIPLCLSFPSLFEVANSKGARLVELWEGLGSEGGWNFRFERSFNLWELDIVNASFVQSIQKDSTL